MAKCNNNNSLYNLDESELWDLLRESMEILDGLYPGGCRYPDNCKERRKIESFIKGLEERLGVKNVQKSRYHNSAKETHGRKND